MSGQSGDQPVKKKRIAFETVSSKVTGFSSMDGRMSGSGGGPSTSSGMDRLSGGGGGGGGLPMMGAGGGVGDKAKKPAGDQLPCDNKTFRIKLSLETRAKDKNFFNQFNW